jgi:hypothetical protein
MSSHPQTTRGHSANVTPSHAPLIVMFEFNQARRAKATRDLGGSKERCYPFVLNVLNWNSTNRSPMLIVVVRTNYRIPRLVELEGFESFVEKRVEYGEMMICKR